MPTPSMIIILERHERGRGIPVNCAPDQGRCQEGVFPKYAHWGLSQNEPGDTGADRFAGRQNPTTRPVAESHRLPNLAVWLSPTADRETAMRALSGVGLALSDLYACGAPEMVAARCTRLAHGDAHGAAGSYRH